MRCQASCLVLKSLVAQIARFMGPTWGPPGSCRPQLGPMLAPWTLLSGRFVSRYSVCCQVGVCLMLDGTTPLPKPMLTYHQNGLCSIPWEQCHTQEVLMNLIHDDVIKWNHFPHYWPFVQGIHRSPVNSPHKGQWYWALMFSLICTWINPWVSNREAGDLRRHYAHNDVIVMLQHMFGDYTLKITSPGRQWVKPMILRYQYLSWGSKFINVVRDNDQENVGYSYNIFKVIKTCTEPKLNHSYNDNNMHCVYANISTELVIVRDIYINFQLMITNDVINT